MFGMNCCVLDETMKYIQRCCLTQSQPHIIPSCPQEVYVVTVMKPLFSGFVINTAANNNDMKKANFTSIYATG